MPHRMQEILFFFLACFGHQERDSHDLASLLWSILKGEVYERKTEIYIERLPLKLK